MMPGRIDRFHGPEHGPRLGAIRRECPRRDARRLRKNQGNIIPLLFLFDPGVQAVRDKTDRGRDRTVLLFFPKCFFHLDKPRSLGETETDIHVLDCLP